VEGRILSSMALLRIISGLLEIAAALLILRLQRVETALRINAFLGLVGPVIFLLVSVMGLIAVAIKLSPYKIGLVITGIILVLLGTRG
jgi:hypothetical protein